MKAVILAAGKGTRMGHLTDEIPKPMIRVSGKPLLEHILDRLREAGIQSAAVVTGYRHELIEEYFERYPLPITFLQQQELNGTATAVRLARQFVASDPFLLTFGDIWCDVADYLGLMAMLSGGTEAVLGVRRVDDPWQGAAVYEQDGAVVNIVEKPAKGASTTNWNSAGLYVFRATVFDELERVKKSPRGEYEITSAIEQMIAAGTKLKIYAIQGKWRDVGRPEDLAAIE
jgi:NDP-sugar pyrophosphorylase family protein